MKSIDHIARFSAKSLFAVSLLAALSACGSSTVNDETTGGGGGTTVPRVQGVSVSANGQSALTVKVGEQVNLSSQLIYSDSTTKPGDDLVTWTSMDTSVLELDANGRGIAKAVGSTLVSASRSGMNSNNSVLVTVKAKDIDPPSPCALATLDISSVPSGSKLLEGSSFTYTVKGYCANGTQKALTSVQWKSSNTAVATIAANSGVATAKVKGQTTISVTADGLAQPASSTLTVESLPIVVEPKKETLKISIGDVSYPYTLDFCPRAAGQAATTRNKLPLNAWLTQEGQVVAQDVTTQVTWTSSLASTAKVTAGEVEALATGAATITAKTAAGTEASFNLNIPACSITVFAKKPASWSGIGLYAWGVSVSNKTVSTWPGASMTADGEWVKYSFPGTDPVNVIFNDGKAAAGDQTTDNMGITQSAWCTIVPGTPKATCAWSATDPRAPVNAVDVKIDPAGATFANTIDVALAYDATAVSLCSYSLDGTDPFSLTRPCPSKLTIGKDARIGDKITLKVCVTDNARNKCKQETYTKADQPKFAKATFTWDNATVYFVITDRFQNGDTSNDKSYGRTKDAANKDIGTFHGGDLKGLTQKLDYIESTGATAIWITAPYEQVHGWVRGTATAGADFKHYGYHGYWPLDFTVLDKNMGTIDDGYGKNESTVAGRNDFREFVDAAHARGIRVVMDVVMNHIGLPTIGDMGEYKIDVLNVGWDKEADLLTTYDKYINWASTPKTPNWQQWWGKQWIRFGVAGSGYDGASAGDVLGGYSLLPDVKTESTEVVQLPPFFKNKPDTNARLQPGYTVRNYFVKWLTDWVRDYGIDGFRVDTVKHVEAAAWKDLKVAANRALSDWKAANPSKKMDDLPFWMVGEVNPYWAVQGWNWSRDPKANPQCVSGGPDCTVNYFDQGGFDALINFQPQYAFTNKPADHPELHAAYKFDKLCAGGEGIERMYTDFADKTKVPGILSYISSHDTEMMFDSLGYDVQRQIRAGTALLMMPRSVQVYYGDESGRKLGPWLGKTEPGTRSDMNWDSANQAIFSHWQKLGQFRAGHAAIGAGSHRALSGVNSGCGFIREYNGDKVAVVMGATGGADVSVPLNGLWADGVDVTDFYTGQTAKVSGGKVSFKADKNGVILIAPTAR